MRRTLAVITNAVPIPAPLPLSSDEPARQLMDEAWDAYREVENLMSRLMILHKVAVRDGCCDSPAWQLWARCATISDRMSARWHRRRKAFEAAR